MLRNRQIECIILLYVRLRMQKPLRFRWNGHEEWFINWLAGRLLNNILDGLGTWSWRCNLNQNHVRISDKEHT